MAFDLAAAKQHLSIDASDTSQDALLQAELDTAMALAERYTNRVFRYEADAEQFHFSTARSLQLRRFPVEALTAIRINGSGQLVPIDNVQLDAPRGLVLFDAPRTERNITVEYTGGYATLPADLEWALWSIFDTVHKAGIDETTTSAATGEISSVTLTGVGTVRFASGGAAAGADDAASLIPRRATTILDLFVLPGA